MTAAVGESEMVERVARAIWPGTVDEDGCNTPSQLRIARAAIEAMHEPTPEMTEGWFEQSPRRVASIWRALIDRALAKATALQKEG